jgi:hypothetical protein
VNLGFQNAAWKGSKNLPDHSGLEGCSGNTLPALGVKYYHTRTAKPVKRGLFRLSTIEMPIKLDYSTIIVKYCCYNREHIVPLLHQTGPGKDDLHTGDVETTEQREKVISIDIYQITDFMAFNLHFL